MGFDGTWEFVIKNTKTNRAVVFKQDPRTSNKQVAFVYARSFEGANAQPSEDVRYDIKNKDLVTFSKLAVEFAEMTDMLTFKSWAQAPQMFEDYVGMPYDKMAMLVNSGFIAEDVLNEEVLIYAGQV